MTSRCVIVTGVASGIGRATADLFVRRGFGVVAVDVDEAGPAALSTVPGIVVPAGDVAVETTRTDAVAPAIERFGRLDTIVLDAGAGGTAPVEDRSARERFDRIPAVDVRSVALGIRSAVPALRETGGGAIVATASVSGLRGDPGTWARNAAEAAVVTLVRATAIGNARQGIRINAIAPGLTATGRTASARADPAGSVGIAARIPLGRRAAPREQAEVIRFLASPAASCLTGVTVPVGGGLDARTGILSPPAFQENRHA